MRFALPCFTSPRTTSDARKRGNVVEASKWSTGESATATLSNALPFLHFNVLTAPRSSLGSRTESDVASAPSPPSSPALATGEADRTSAKARFVEDNPSWLRTLSLDDMRRKEFARLNQGCVYLDWTGAGLYPESIVEQHFRLLLSSTLGNPHSVNPTSKLASAHQAAARASILEFFDADSDFYSVIFTANASAALKLVGEAYPFSPATALVLQCDCHNAVNGVRAFAKRSGSPVEYIGRQVSAPLREDDVISVTPQGGSGLVILTGQSNFTGMKIDLELFRGCHERGFDTFLDAAALAPTTPISLSGLGNTIGALGISLYKMVGYPTGVGALVIRNDLLEKLERPWFSGGTVKLVQVPGDGVLMADGHERFEDGTPNFLSFSPIPSSLTFLKKHQPALSIRLHLLTTYLISALSTLRHPGGAPIVVVHFPTLPYDPKSAGALLTVGFQDEAAKPLSDVVVELAAADAGISIRSGCLCNHGAAASLAGVAVSDSDATAITSLRQWLDVLGLEDIPGIVRVSFGLAPNWEDAWAFLKFARSFEGEGVSRMKVKYGERAAEHTAKRLK